MYATTSELKTKTFTLNKKNIKQEVDIELTETLEIRFQNQHFSEECHRFFTW